MKIDSFTLFKIMHDVKLANSTSLDELNKKLPDRMVSEEFHNNILMYISKLSDDILNCTDELMRRRLRNDRKELIENYREFAQTMNDTLFNYYSDLQFEYADNNNGEYISDALEDPMTYCTIEQIIREDLVGQDLHDLRKQIYINAVYSDQIKDNYGTRTALEDVQELIDNIHERFPNLSYNDCNIIACRVTKDLYNVSETYMCLLEELQHLPDAYEKYEHHVEHINSKSFNKLLQAFYSAYENHPTNNNIDEQINNYSFVIFKTKLNNLILRSKHSINNDMIIHTLELENILLRNILTYRPDMLDYFIQFLIENKIVLPLDRLHTEMYGVSFINYDNATIKRAFIMQGNTSMINMDEFRKKVLSKDELEEVSKNLKHITKSNISIK